MDNVMLSYREAGQVVTSVIEVGSPTSLLQRAQSGDCMAEGALLPARLILQSTGRTSLALSSD